LGEGAAIVFLKSIHDPAVYFAKEGAFKMYSLNDKLTPTQFEVLRKSDMINPQATYQDYLALQAERAAVVEEALRLGLTGDEPPGLDDFMEMQPLAT